jgi:hypothetical protein
MGFLSLIEAGHWVELTGGGAVKRMCASQAHEDGSKRDKFITHSHVLRQLELIHVPSTLDLLTLRKP